MTRLLCLPLLALLFATAAVAQPTVTLAWDSSDTATSYTVHFGLTPNTYVEARVVGDVLTYEVSPLEYLTTYYFAVTASNVAGTSGYSNEVNTTTPQVPLPDPPLNLRIVAQAVASALEINEQPLTALQSAVHRAWRPGYVAVLLEQQVHLENALLVLAEEGIRP